jgi:hypothetical protein
MPVKAVNVPTLLMLFVAMFKGPVIGVWPSEATDCVSASAIFVIVALAQLEAIVVPVTTGLPAGRV